MNQTQNMLKFTINDPQSDASISIYTISGRVILEDILLNNEMNTTTNIDISNFGSGIYFYSILNNGHYSSDRFSVVR